MTPLRCCGHSQASRCAADAVPAQPTGTPRKTSLSGRTLDFAGCIVPGLLLVLVPKCPACLAAYVALATGVGLSFTTASLLRTVMIMFCLAVPVFVAVRLVRREFASGLRRQTPLK